MERKRLRNGWATSSAKNLSENRRAGTLMPAAPAIWTAFTLRRASIASSAWPWPRVCEKSWEDDEKARTTERIEYRENQETVPSANTLNSLLGRSSFPRKWESSLPQLDARLRGHDRAFDMLAYSTRKSRNSMSSTILAVQK
jgi:hypothetical protein